MAKTKPETVPRDENPAWLDKWDDESSFEIEGWYNPELMVGKWTFGTLLGYIEIEDDNGIRENAVLRLGSACQVALKGGETILLDSGQVIGVGKRAQLASVFALDPGSKIAIMPLEKIKLKTGGRTMWKFRVRIDPASRKSRTVAAVRRERTEADARPRADANGQSSAEDSLDEAPF